MASSLSMTTQVVSRQPKTRPAWRIRRDVNGEIRWFLLKERKTNVLVGGTVYATMPSRLVSGDKTDEVIAATTRAGGRLVSAKGRTMLVEVDGQDIEAVGEALDSFGCQWGFQEG